MILDNSFPPDPRVENEALTLIENGHQVFLFCFDNNGNLPKTEIYKGININRCKINKIVYKLSALAYTIPVYHIIMQPCIKKFATKYQIEAFHIHDIQIARSVFKANKKLKIPIILDLHENRPEIMKFYSHVNSFFGKLLINPKTWKKFEYQYINKANRTIVVTNEAKNYYLDKISICKSRIYVVPNSTRKEFYLNYKLSKSIIENYKDKFTILYLGNTGLRRGLETAILALEHLIYLIPNIKLVIVGKSSTDNILINKVKELGYDKYVDFVGWQDVSFFPSYIISSDIGICPIHKNIHHDTTYANKLFQHLSFGKPLIVSDSTAQANLVNKYNCGLVFPDRNSKALAKCIISLHQNKEQYENFSANGLTAIEQNLNWDILSKQLIKLYAEL